MLLTEAQLQEIREIIADHHNAFVANVLSPKVIAPEILERLKQKGLFAPKFESVRESYLYGQLLASLDNPAVASMSYEEMKRYIRTHPVPLTEIERQAITMAQQQAGQYAVGLGNRVDQETGQILIEADHVLRQQLRDEIKTATAENIARRESVKQLKSDLGWKTRDWARDWDRIAVTEKQNAMQHGVADNIAAKYGTEARVAKRPMPDACQHCKRLHIGPDGQPRIFKLSTLIGNGANFHQKVGDWQAVVGPVHPHCQCQLIRIPDGFGFDEDGRLVPGGKLGSESEDLEASLRAEDELAKSGRMSGKLTYQGIPIRVESPAGSVRHWKMPDGTKGATKMRYPYGFVEKTEGQDGDEVDVFVGPDPRAPMAFIVHQQDPKTQQYDETKCFVGFPDKKTAEKVYRMHYNRPDFNVWTDELTVDAFKRWLGGMEKSTPPRRERFVLGKSDGTPQTLAVSERALGEVRGTAANIAMGSPPRGIPKSDPSELVPDVREILRLDEEQTVPESMKRDLKIYDFKEVLDRYVRTVDIPESWKEDFKKLRTDTAERLHADTARQYRRDKPVSRNTTDVTESKPLEKSVSRIERKPVLSLPDDGVSR